jgi:RNA polymerase sigma-70 factor, ECF subfamily
MARYAGGDDSAFAQVFRGLFEPLRRFLRRLCGSNELADDLVQETFLRVHRARTRFVPDQGVERWVYTIARNCFLSHTRLSRSRLASSCRNVDDYALASNPDTNAEALAIARETEKDVLACLNAMSAASREAFVRVRLEEESVAEAATRLGISSGALKLRTFRASELLRQAVAKPWRSPKRALRVSSGRTSSVSCAQTEASSGHVALDQTWVIMVESAST